MLTHYVRDAAKRHKAPLFDYCVAGLRLHYSGRGSVFKDGEIIDPLAYAIVRDDSDGRMHG